jgi:hypothetical protein
MPARSRLFVLIASTLAMAIGGSGCDGCGRRGENREKKERTRIQAAPARDCEKTADCDDGDPCTRQECVDERCVATLVPPGTSCDNETVCDGVAACDANGRCVDGAPPLVDDGNPCTVDACDQKRGVLHDLVPVDDFDACTTDACDPSTGQITHTTLKVDDGNDCTKDSCDPRSGPKHEQPNPVYTCQARCEPGFHVASRTPSPECGSPQALRSFCAPDCGASFHTCEANCPNGYQKRAASPGGSCGTNPSIMVFCVKG